jgi:ADP-heptose:LPS heptosyltransferase
MAALIDDLTGRRARIAVLRGTPGLGDALCAVPSWRALRAAVPDAHITLVAQPWITMLRARFGAYLDDHLPFGGFPGIHDAGQDVRESVRCIALAQERRFDLVIQQHGSGMTSNIIAALLGGDRTAGFTTTGAYVPDPETFLPYPADMHEIHRHLRLMAFLGAPSAGDALEFPLGDADRAGAARVVDPSEVYVVLHPGAKDPARRWPPECFATVGRALERRGVRLVITGTTAERALCTSLAGRLGPNAVVAAGRTDIGELGALVDGAAMVLTNDTGTSHLAVARGTPSVVVVPPGLGPTWLPLDRSRHRVVAGVSGPADPVAVQDAAAELLGAIAGAHPEQSAFAPTGRGDTRGPECRSA